MKIYLFFLIIFILIIFIMLLFDLLIQETYKYFIIYYLLI